MFSAIPRSQQTADFYFVGMLVICAAVVIRDWKKYECVAVLCAVGRHRALIGVPLRVLSAADVGFR